MVVELVIGCPQRQVKSKSNSLPLSLLEWKDAGLHCGVEVRWPTVRAGQAVGVYSLGRRRDERMSNLEQSFLMVL